jgi:hypothetical protein
MIDYTISSNLSDSQAKDLPPNDNVIEETVLGMENITFMLQKQYKFLVLSQVWKSVDNLHKNLEHGSSGCVICVSPEQWSTSYLIDHLKQHLATYTQVITNNEGKTAKVRIYYDQAFQLLRIGAYKPAPPYVIQFSHLTPRLQTELDQLHNIVLIYVLKQAVSRIFEDINLELYHNSISRVLRVVLQR